MLQERRASSPGEFLNGGRRLWPGQRCLNRPGKGGRSRTDTDPEDGVIWSERILSAAARGTWPLVFSEMSVSAAAPEDVPAMYFVGARVAKRRQSVGCLGRGSAVWYRRGALSQKKTAHTRLFGGADHF